MNYRKRVIKSRQKTKYLINGIMKPHMETRESPFSLIINTTTKPNNFGRFLFITKRECTEHFMGIDENAMVIIKMIQRLEK